MSLIPWDYAKRNHTNTMEGVIISKHFIDGDLKDKTIVDLVPIIRDDMFYNYPGIGKNFPFYAPQDNNARDEFMNTFILKYYQHNFVQETTGYFLARWLAKITEVTPYYTELYKTIIKDIDFLNNRDYTITRIKKGNETEKENNSRNANSIINSSRNSNTDFQTINSDNPQTNFAGVDYASGMSRGNSVNKTTDNSTQNDTENANRNRDRNNNESETEIMKGYVGNDRTELLMNYRNAIININSLLCNEFDGLFSYFN